MPDLMKLVVLLMTIFLGYPAIVLWGFNILNEQGQWGLANISHGWINYLAVVCISVPLKLRLVYSPK